MTQNISRVFDNRREAENAVRALERGGFTSDSISLLSHSSDDGETMSEDLDGASNGATIGGVAGAGVGVLASLGMIAIPGIGPLVAAGMLATTLAAAGTGAVAGGLAGALIDYGVSGDDAHVYSEAVRRGSTLVSVKTTPDREMVAERIMAENGAVDTGSRRQHYEKSGWSGYDPKSPVYSAEEARRERDIFRS
jgi:hypothetical protein